MGEFLFPRDLYVNKPSSLNTGSVWVSTDTNRFFVGPMELPVLQNANTFERTITLQTPTSSVNTLGLNITETRTGSTYIPFTQLVNPYGSISTYLYQSNTRGFVNNAYKGVTIYNVVSGAVIKSTSNLEFNSFISSTGSVIKLNSNLVDLYGNKPELADSFLVNISGNIKASGTVSGSIFNATTYQVLGTDISSIYQATLVSGTNIKTINGESLLGSGNIVITGSSGSVGITDGDKGDITVSSSGSIWTINNNAITDSKVSGSISQSKITSLVSDLSSKAPIASPTFTGTLTAPTLNGTSDIQLNGTSINTTGTLTNVAYYNKVNPFTQPISISPPNATSNPLTLNRGDMTNFDIVIQKGGLDRWRIRMNNTTETGSNAGSDFAILRRNDDGTPINTFPLFIYRSNGFVGINNNTPTEALDVTGNIKASGTVSSTGASSSVNLANSASQPQVSITDVATGYQWFMQHRMDTRNHFRIQYYNGTTYYAPFMIELDAPSNSIVANSVGVGINTPYTAITEQLTVTGNIKASGTVSGNLIQSNGNVVLLNSGVDQFVRGSTSDGSDNGGLKLTPASSPSVSRGAVITMYGNEHATLPGQILVASGQVTGSKVIIAHNGTTRILIDDDNDIDITGNIKASENIQLSKTLLVPMLSKDTEGYGIKIGNTTLFNSHFAQGANASYNLDMMHNTLISNTAGTETYKWVSTHASFGSRGISFRYGTTSGKGIIFYADAVATTAGSTFTPTQRMIIQNDGKVGIGLNPTEVLDVAGNIKASGTVTAPTLNGTTAIQLNGTSINTAGTLDNVVYKNQNNNFTTGQTITEALDVDIFNYLSDELIPNNTFSEGIASWSVAPNSTNWLEYVGGKLIFNASWVFRRSHYLQSSGSVFSYNTGDYIVYELQLSSSSNLSYVDIPYSLPSQSLIRSGITYFTNQVTSSVTLQNIAYCTGSGSGYYRVNISPNTSTTCSVVIDNVSVRKISPPDVTTFATFTNLNEQKLSIYNVPRSQDPLGNDLGTLSLKIGTNNNESPISRFGENSNIFIGNNNFSSSISCPLNTRDILVVGNNNLSNVSNSSPQGFLLHQSSVILGNNILANASVPYIYDHNILIGMDVLKDSKVTVLGDMIFIGYRSGRESNSQNSVVIGTYSGEYSKGYGNVLLGQNAGQYASSSGSGAQTAVGGYALAGVSNNRLIGNFNTAIGGYSSRYLSDTSSENFSGGFYSLKGNSASGTAPCSNNVAVGSYALQSVNFVNSTVAVGHSSLGGLVQGRYIVAIGQSAGEIAAEAATHNYCSQSVFIGAYTKPQANSGSNEIVIGFNVTGKGSNTATIGQGLTATYLSGTVSGSIFNATTYQVLGTNISSLYQATLVSGTNIKTINGNSLLGSGNIVITGSSGSVGITNPVFYGVVSVTGSISATGSISCNTLYANEVIIGSGTGSLPKSGTLASPPAGLAIGESWLDTTDSTTHPILRMRVL